MPEWTPYRCTIPAPGQTGFSQSICATLDEVYHVAHVPAACRILEDGMIRAGLIGDESRLKKTRTSVIWVSGNYWNPGSIYGTVQFTFPWKELIANNRVYWVEVMDYPNPAYRFLITRRDLSESKYVAPYDPESEKGPLRRKGDKWYWNDQYTSEFMLDRDLDLNECTKLSFISHRPNICRIHGSGCTERTKSPSWSAGRVMAYTLGKGLKTANHIFYYQGSESAQNRLSSTAESGLNTIWRGLAPKKGSSLGPIKKQKSNTAVLRGALLLFGNSRSEAKNLSALLNSEAVFEDALTEIVREHFGFSSYTLPP